MDAQVENAIETAWNPSSSQNLKSQALDFLNQLRSEPQGWQICLSLVVRNPKASEIVRHVSLDVINDAIQARHIEPQGLLILRDNLLGYLQDMYGAGGNGNLQLDSAVVQNKITQTVTYLFTTLYATEWITFFHDLLGLTVSAGSSSRDNEAGVTFYLRVLVSVHDEIADTLIPRSPDEQSRDNNLKDLVRQRDVKAIALSWQEIITQWRSQPNQIIEQCLTVVGKWVAWTEISLILSDTLLNLLFELVGPPQPTTKPGGAFSEAVNGANARADSRRYAAIDTLIEILGKKMSADDKLELIEVLKIKDIVSRLTECYRLQELRSTSNYDTDLAESVAKLVNNTVYDIVKAIDGAQDSDSASVRGISQLNAFLPFVLRLFSDEYDEICSNVIPCLTDLQALFRKKAKLNSNFYSQSETMLSPILDAVIAKMKYDHTSLWGHEDAQTDEAEFQELRKRLQVLQQAVAAVNENLYMDKISALVISTFDQFQNQRGQLNWRDIDLAMYEMFLFGELALKSGALYSKTKPVSPAAERLIGMMFKLVESDVASFPHPAIQLQYMEICVRYYSFFEANPQFVNHALENFVTFVHHNHVKVRTRSWYLFHRFVKHVRQHIGDIAENVIRALGDLLPIKAELPEETSDNGDMSSDENEQTASARFSSQLYLYEAVGSICSIHGVPVNNQVIYVRSVISPLFTDLETHLGLAKTGDERATLQVHHLVMALGTLARGFSDWSPASTAPTAHPPAKEVSEEFTQTSEAILVALETLNSSLNIRTAARFAFSRLIGVLGSRILPQLPRWINGLLSQTSSKDEMALFLRLLDQVVYGFKSEIFEILNTLLTPFLQRVFTGIGEPAAGTDDEIQLAELKREYLSFLLIILNNDLASVLVSETNQSAFTAVISTIEHLAKDTADFPNAKLAFAVLIRMVYTWGGPDIQSSPQQIDSVLPTVAPQPTLPGFDRFMIERFSPLCWAIPTQPTFDPRDAQGRLVLAEAASLQKAIYAKTGQEYLTWLREAELRGTGMDAATVEGYLVALGTLDLKGFRQFFQNLMQQSNR